MTAEEVLEELKEDLKTKLKKEVRFVVEESNSLTFTIKLILGGKCVTARYYRRMSPLLEKECHCLQISTLVPTSILLVYETEDTPTKIKNWILRRLHNRIEFELLTERVLITNRILIELQDPDDDPDYTERVDRITRSFGAYNNAFPFASLIEESPDMIWTPCSVAVGEGKFLIGKLTIEKEVTAYQFVMGNSGLKKKSWKSTNKDEFIDMAVKETLQSLLWKSIQLKCPEESDL